MQRVWDLHLQETEMTLVLVGSSISIMEEKVLAGGSPLYGRRTATIDLPPLSLADARELYPAENADETIQSWGVFGGLLTISRHYLPSRRFLQIFGQLFFPNTGFITTNRNSSSVRSSEFRSHASGVRTTKLVTEGSFK